jgi:hypothetical protein
VHLVSDTVVFKLKVMKVKLIITILLMSIIFLSCANIDVKGDRHLAFINFIKKFKPIELPLLIQLEGDKLLESSEEISLNSTDTIFIKPKGNYRTYGYLRDTSKYYAFIYVIIGDEPSFRLITFDKSLNKIADSCLMNSEGCTPGTLCLNCKTAIEIKSNSMIKTIDSLNYLDCDSTGNSTNTIVQRKRLEQTILIDNKGDIKIIKE